MRMRAAFAISCSALLLATAGAVDARPHPGGFGGGPGWMRRGPAPPPWIGRPPPPRIFQDPRMRPGPNPRMMGPPGYRRERDQDAAFDARRAGEIRSLREIESRVVPRMPGATYLGPEFDAESATYRLKFMRRGSVTWLDVDGRTGQVIGRSGY